MSVRSSQVGKDIELDAVGRQFEPYRPYRRMNLHAGGATWDAAVTVVVIEVTAKTPPF